MSQIDKLKEERDAALQELEEIKKKFDSKNDDFKNESRVAELEAENKELNNLITQYKNDIKMTTEFAQKIFLEYGKKIDVEKENQQEQTQEQKDIEEANEALKKYYESKTEKEE